MLFLTAINRTHPWRFRLGKTYHAAV